MIPNDAEIKLTATWNCKACGGAGIVQNPVWKEFFAQQEKEWERLMKPENDAEMLEWFRARGATTWQQHRILKTESGYPLEIPHKEIEVPEDETCGECEGEGKISQQISLDEALNLCPTIQGLTKAAQDANALANGIIPD